MRVIIMRGSSGSGKSTFIEQNFPNAFVCSADHYFMEDGKYIYSPSKIGQAHRQCLRRFMGAVQQLSGASTKTIVVDNTNMQIWEIAPYIKIAQAYDAAVEVHHMKANAFTAACRNLHGCDETIVRRQLGNYQSLPRGLKSGVTTDSHST